MSPRLGLARLISQITAGFPAATFARSARSNPRTGPAARARLSISRASTRARASSTSTRWAARISLSTPPNSGRPGEAARELHQLVELGARRPSRDRVPRERHAVPEARRDARDVESRGGVERHDVARGPRLVREDRLDPRARFVGVLHPDRLDRRHIEAELLRIAGVFRDEV